jgi:hypothetical protein
MSPRDAVTVVRKIREKLLFLKGVKVCPRYPADPLSVPRVYHPESHLILCTGIKNALSSLVAHE